MVPKDAKPEEEILLVDGDFVATDCLRHNRNDAEGRSIKKMVLKHLEWIEDYKHVYFTMGNHEHYKGDIRQSKDILSEFLHHNHFSNMRVLEDEHVELMPGVHLLACTLWTDMNRDNPITHQVVGDMMNDFRVIRNGEGAYFTTRDAVNIHRRSLSHLTETYHYLTHDFEKKKPDGKTQIIIMTHHHPSERGLTDSHRHQYNLDANYGYFSNLEDWILDRPQISHWVVGHTHNPCDYMIGNCNVLSNPRGYGILGYEDQCFKPFTVANKVIRIGGEDGNDKTEGT